MHKPTWLRRWALGLSAVILAFALAAVGLTEAQAQTDRYEALANSAMVENWPTPATLVPPNGGLCRLFPDTRVLSTPSGNALFERKGYRQSSNDFAEERGEEHLPILEF